jgi:tetratricopeptide (TPR) repeat protein
MSTRPLIPTILVCCLLFSSCSKAAKEARYFKEAEAAFKSGAYDKAKIDYVKVIQLNNRNAVAFARVGQIWLEEGAPLRAGGFLKKAAELAPKDHENRVRLARVYQFVGKRDDAQKELLAVLQQKPNDGEALIALSETVHNEKDIADADAVLQKFPDKQTVAYELASANVALRKRDLSGASAAIDRALQLDPKSAEAHQAKGIIQVLEHHTKVAGEEFKKAADLASPRSNIKVVYAEYKRQAEGEPAARAYLQELTKKTPDFLPPWILLGRMSVADKKYDQALAELENVFSRDPQNIDARLVQSDLLLAQGQFDKAATELDKLDKAFPGLPQVKYRIAQTDLQQNKLPQAAAALDEAIARNPQFVEAIILRAQLNLRTGHASEAITALEGLLKKQPALKPAQLLLADAYRAENRFDDAAAIFEQQIKSAPQAPEGYFFLGVVQLQQKKLADARQSFQKVLKLSPNNLPAIDQLVSLDLQEKKFAEATQMVQDQIKKHPDTATPYLLEGRILVAQEKWSEAEAVLKKALQLDPTSGPGYEMLVHSYLATNKLPQAAQELETVLSKSPKNQSALMTLATIREQQKDYAKARDAYEKILEFNPKFVPALNNLSYLYAERFNQPDKALELAQKARTLDPGNPSVADTLGWASYKRGDYQQALTLLQESAGKLENPEIQFHLGMAHYMSGQAEAARAAFQKALAEKADFPSRAEAQNRLALLGDASGAAAALTVPQLEEMVKHQPNDLIARLRLAEAYKKNGDANAAAREYEAALKINPKLPSAVLALAQIYSGPVPDPKKALAFAKQARSLLPNDPNATAVLGRIAFKNGDFNWSADLLQEASRGLSSDPNVLHDLAWSTYSLGKVENARDAMQRSLQASPDPATAEDAKSFLALTAAVSDPAALAASKPEVEAKLKADPNYVPGLMAAAALDLQSNDQAAAISRYQTVLQRFPDFAPAQKQLALLYADEPSHAADAYDLASKARRTLPDDPALGELLGRLSYEKKDFSSAAHYLKESARAKPLDANGLFYLGMSQLEGNDKPAGRQALKQALSQGLKEPLAAKASEALATGSQP